MNPIRIHIIGANATVIEPQVVTAGMVGLPVEFSFDSAWDGLSKTAVFRAGDITRKRSDITSSTTVAYEVLQKAGYMLQIGMYGVDEDDNIVIPTVWADAGMIRKGTSNDVKEAADPSADGSGDSGSDGGSGGYYTPSVTQVDESTIRFDYAASNADMPEVAAETVTLPAGPAGYTPAKGVDYYTAADKAELVEAVLAAMPEVTAVDFSGFEDGTWTETVDGKVITHTVSFDAEGNVVAIDNIAVTMP